MLVDLAENRWNVVADSPIRIMTPESLQAADPPDVVTDPVNVAVRGRHWPADDVLAELDRFHHRAVAVPPSPDVVNLAAARRGKKGVERGDQVGAMDIVADLLATISVNRIRLSGYRTLHQ